MNQLPSSIKRIEVDRVHGFLQRAEPGRGRHNRPRHYNQGIAGVYGRRHPAFLTAPSVSVPKSHREVRDAGSERVLRARCRQHALNSVCLTNVISGFS